MRTITAIVCSCLAIASSVAFARTPPTAPSGVEAVFEKVKDDQARLRVFLQEMPKGGDLHYHLSGSIFAEDYVRWAADRGFCFDDASQSLVAPPCAQPLSRKPASNGPDSERFNAIVSALSTRGLTVEQQEQAMFNGRGFAVFDRLAAIIPEVSGESIAAARNQLADNGNSYAEVTFHPPILDRTMRGYSDEAWDPADLEGAFKRRLPTAQTAVSRAIAELNEAEALSGKLLACDTPARAEGCGAQVRYLAFARRLMPADKVFTSLMTAFMLADKDPRYAGINFVGPEDRELPLKDYRLHMEMIEFLGEKFPKVRRTAHTGELTLGIVPTTWMRDDIRLTIEVGGVQRVGHAASMAYQRSARELLAKMAREGIAVEINQSTNKLLPVKGSAHPIRMFLAAGVPIVISTDDQGLARTDATVEFMTAVQEHGLTYQDLKKAVRNSLEYAFLGGESYWLGRSYDRPNAGCSAAAQPAAMPAPCQRLIQTSEKARMQLDLERAFLRFEREIVQSPF